MSTISISISKATVARHKATIPASLTYAEVARVFDKVRSNGIPCDTAWSWGGEVIPAQHGATILYFNMPSKVSKVRVLKRAVHDVLSERPQS